ncbi:MAG: glycosyltransferase family 2 protein [Ottowia sp.]|nr:glycosyltransferase family 2 protein [Ottowia sp.]
MKLVIQIPCYNEEKTLHVAVNDLPKHIAGIDEIETLIIDDGSRDGTVAEAKHLGVNHIVRFKRNKGLARGFMAGMDAALRVGADIIVNTDADNQYNAADIEKLVAPILDGSADEVIGARPIDDTEHFSWRKKKLQHLGSWIVRKASDTDIPDAPSGFRAFSREAALRLNVFNEYTYTLETIIQAGRDKIAITSVPIRTNPELRESHLFKSIRAYVQRSAGVIIRAYMMYRPLKFFSVIGGTFFLLGVLLGVRFLAAGATGHVQSLILAAVLMLLGAQTFFMGLQADLIAANRKMLEEIQYRLRRRDAEDAQQHAPQDARSDA